MYIRCADRYLMTSQSFFLFGPRGTGKTTWLKMVFPDAIFIDLLQSDICTSLTASPGKLEHFIPERHNGRVVIDEVQRIPSLLNEVHRLIEEKGISFVLTGSSARALRKKGVNLLAGRALTYRFHPLTVQELGSDFSLETSLQYGHLPFVYQAGNRADYLASYIQTYLREEVLQEGLARSMGAFTRFLETASFSQAGLVNASEIGRETGVDRKTVDNYFQITEDLLIGKRLPPFTKRSKRRLVAGDKFFFFDCGIYRSLRPVGPLDIPEEVSGAALETLVFQELCALNDYHGLGLTLYYWRTSSGAEVDFVLYGQNAFIAIEVKRTRHLKASQLSGLKLFKKDYPQARCFLVCGVSQKEFYEGIEVWPVSDFLRNLHSLLTPVRPEALS
ncbi:MAG: ATP-binding protein [Treponema sp.]|nr:ATP-binding protein [Treponema sp.]